MNCEIKLNEGVACPAYATEVVYDNVKKAKHYNVHPSKIECIDIIQHMNFCLGNAIKYLWRAGDKHESPIEDLKKAVWYINKEIERLEKP